MSYRGGEPAEREGESCVLAHGTTIIGLLAALPLSLLFSLPPLSCEHKNLTITLCLKFDLNEVLCTINLVLTDSRPMSALL